MSNILPAPNRRDPRALRSLSDPLDLSAELEANAKGGTEFKGLREYLAMIARHWLIFILVVAAAVGYTANGVRKERPRYKANATVRLVDPRRAIAGDITSGNQGGPDMPFSMSADPIQSQIQILLSDAVASVAVDQSGLRLVPAADQHFLPQITSVSVADSSPASSIVVRLGANDFTIVSGTHSATAAYGATAVVDGVALSVGSRPASGPNEVRFDIIPRDAAVAHALDGFQVTPRPRTDILDLSSTGFEAEETRRIANAMAQAFQKYNTENAQKFARRRRSFLEEQLRQSDSALAVANVAYGNFKSGRESSVAVSGAKAATYAEVTTQRTQVESDKRTVESLLNRAKQSTPPSASSLRALVGSPALAASPLMQQLASTLATQENMRDGLLSGGAAPTNPDLVAINGQMAITASRIVDAAESYLDNLDSRLQALNRTGGSVTAAVPAAGGMEAREAQLGQDVQTAQKLSSQLKEELQKAKLAEAVEAGQVEIVQPARYAGYQIATGKKRKLMMGLLVGLMFGFGAAVLVDSLDRSIRRRGDVESMLGVPGLVVIPRLGGPGGTTERMMRALPRSASRSSGKTESARKDLVTLHDPQSPSAEAFRTLRTNLMFSQAVEQMQVLVVTSASPGEGKTITAANLAVSFAQQGMRVLLIDCDLRRGRLHKVFDAKREPGFTDLILGYSTEETVTVATEVPGLYVISSGKLPPNPAELLGGEKSKVVIRNLTEGYDLVILDTPPLLAASDAAILATAADGVIMVLRAGATESTAAQQSMQQLQTLGARVVGAVLNDPESQVPKYGAYYKYDYSGSEA